MYSVHISIMIFPTILKNRGKIPFEIIFIIKQYLDQDEIYDFGRIFTQTLVKQLSQNRDYKMHVCKLPSYYDCIRQSQVTKKHGFRMKWRYIRPKFNNETSQTYSTKMIMYNNKNKIKYIATVFDTLYLDERDRPFTERSARIEIDLRCCSIPEETLFSMIQLYISAQYPLRYFELYNHRIWLIDRTNIYFTLHEDYSTTYHLFSNLVIFKKLDILCYELHNIYNKCITTNQMYLS